MLRGIDSALWQRLREKAASERISIKTAAIKALDDYADDPEADPDLRPSISVNDLRAWFVEYALKHEGTDRERIADEIADYIDQERENGR